MTPTRLLLVDDDEGLAELLAEYLRIEGYDVELAHTAASGLQAALAREPALVILDVMLPDGSGVEVLQRIRAVSEVPVLMLTARGDPVDRILGLEHGADDYIPKPCMPRELSARVRAVLRRSATRPRSGAPLVAGPLQMWPERRRLTWEDQAVTLTSSEFDLVGELLRQPGTPVSKDDLSLRGLGRPLGRFDRSIDVHISSIRHKLGAISDGRCSIEAVRGRGYQLVVE